MRPGWRLGREELRQPLPGACRCSASVRGFASFTPGFLSPHWGGIRYRNLWNHVL